MKNKKILIVLALVSHQQAFAWTINTDSFQKWTTSLQPKLSVQKQIEMFFSDQNIDHTQDEVQKYIPNFIQHTHQEFTQKVIDILNHAENPSLKCSNQTEIDFPETITQNKTGEEFESEALFVESMDCLGQLDHNKVFKTLLSDEFQKKSVNGLKEIRTDETKNLVCQKTNVFPIGRSEYCFTQNIWKNDSTYVIQSFNESNHNQPSAPVYFREVYTVIKKLKSGEVFLYNVVLGRGPDLPFHSIVKKTVRNQQAAMISQLIEDSK